MEKVIIISDSHGNMDNVKKIFKKEKDVDMVIHLGDILSQDNLLKEICNCNVIIVKGNCDYSTENRIFEVIDINGVKIFATHGHKYNVGYSIDSLYMAAKENECKVAMYGHTHVPDNSIYRGMYILNPGSVSKPRQLNCKSTYAIMCIDDSGNIDIRTQYV